MIRTARIGLALLAAACALPAGAAPPPVGPTPPKLIVVISVDQFSADLFAQYRQRFTDGLRRLEQDGAVFPSGYQSHAATETCPGHSTILTGDHPARTGIVANTWMDLSVTRGEDSHAVYCAEDERRPGTTSTSADYVVSPIHLRVPTLGDRMKRADPAARVVAVAGKDRAAVMMGGHMTDQIWFLDPKKSRSFATLDDHTGTVPAAVQAANRIVADTLDRPAPRRTDSACAALVENYDLAGGGRVGRAEGPAKPDDLTDFRTSPRFDAIVADLGLGLMRELKLGHGTATDLLIFGLSATDYVGHAYGPGGPEMCTQMVALDRTIGRIIAALDANGAPYELVLTADHGGLDLAERSAAHGVPQAQRVTTALTPAAIGAKLAAQFGLTIDPKALVFADSPFGDWYLSNALPPPLRPQLLAALKTTIEADPQVATVLTAERLERMPSPRPPVEAWTLAERARASFDPARSGDLIVLLKPYVTPIATPKTGLTSTHGSPWDYDRRVPILFYRPGVRGFEQPLPIETIDILPTLAATIRLPIAAGDIDGRCLPGVIGAACTPQ